MTKIEQLMMGNLTAVREEAAEVLVEAPDSVRESEEAADLFMALALWAGSTRGQEALQAWKVRMKQRGRTLYDMQQKVYDCVQPPQEHETPMDYYEATRVLQDIGFEFWKGSTDPTSGRRWSVWLREGCAIKITETYEAQLLYFTWNRCRPGRGRLMPTLQAAINYYNFNH